MIITPTVGRVLWYWPKTECLEQMGLHRTSLDQPFMAQVTFVHSDRMVNLLVTDHRGAQAGVQGVFLLQEGDTARIMEGYAQWMPYQKAQAEKAA